MVPAVTGGTTFLTSTILLSLWGAGVIGKKEKSDEKVNVNITGNIQGENKKSPFQDYWEVVEKIKSGNVYDFCTGETKYDSYNDSFIKPAHFPKTINNEEYTLLLEKETAEATDSFSKKNAVLSKNDPDQYSDKLRDYLKTYLNNFIVKFKTDYHKEAIRFIQAKDYDKNEKTGGQEHHI